MKRNSGLVATGIEQILELAAVAQANRRSVAKGSPAFHNLTGAIAAYGKVLAIFVALEQLEEFDTKIGQCDLSACVADRAA